MKRANPASITATFVSAILSLILPASALAADDTVRPHRDPLPVQQPSIERSPADAFRDDPILKSIWGPGDPDLVVSKFHFARKAKSPPPASGNGKTAAPNAASAPP